MAEIDFTKYQTDVCEQPEPLPPLKKMCAPCTPNDCYIEPDWTRRVGDPYLNEKTCEYMVCVTVNKNGNSAKLGRLEGNSSVLDFRNYAPGVERERLFRKFVQPGLILMLQRFGKLISDQIMCAHFDGPTLRGMTSVEMLETYDEFKKVFVLLKDDPLSDGEESPTAKPCKDFIPGDLENLIPVPGEPYNLTDAVIEIMATAPEVTNPYALEIYAYAKDFYIEAGAPLKVLIAIPAFIFDAVPDAPTTKDIQDEAAQTRSEVELDIGNLFGQVMRLSSALFVYGKYQSHFYQSQDGFMVFKKTVTSKEGESKEISKDFYASQYSGKVLNFYDKLKEVGKDNKFNLRSALPSIIMKNATKLKIIFDGSDPDNPYKIKEIKAKQRGCPYVTFTKSLDKLGTINEDGVIVLDDPTLLNYFAKLAEIDVALQARKSYPWVDFLLKFTFPLLSVSYGNLSPAAVEDTAGSCIAENVNSFGVELKDYILDEVLSLMEVFQFTYSSHNCTAVDDLSGEPEVVERQKKQSPSGRQAKRETKDSQEAEIQKQLESYTKAIAQYEQQKTLYENELRAVKDGPDFEDSQYLTGKQEKKLKKESLEGSIKMMKSSIKSLEKKKKEEYKKLNDKETRKDNRKEANQARKDAAAARRDETHPYVLQARKLAGEQIATQDNLLTTLYDFDKFGSEGFSGITAKDIETDDEFKAMVKRMSLCNVRSLTLQAVRCLFNGVTEEDALTKIVKATLSAMDLDVFGIFVKGLPPQVQQDIKAKLQENFKDLPLPWEEGYDAGALDKTNPYTLALKTPVERLEARTERVAGRTERRTERAEGRIDEAQTLLDQIANARVEIDETQNGIVSLEAQIEEIVALTWEEFYLAKEARKVLEQGGGATAQEVIDATVAKRHEYDNQRLTLEGLVVDTRAQQERLNLKIEETQREADRAEKTITRSEDTVTKLEDRWAELTDEERVSAAQSATDQSRIKIDGDPDNLGSPGTYGAALGDAQELIMDAYIDYVMDVMQIDQLYALLDRFPGSEIIGAVLTDFGCSVQGMFKPPIKSFLSTLALDTCGGVSGGLTTPSLEKMHNFNTDGLMLPRMKKAFVTGIESLIVEVMKRLLLKVFETIDGALCKSINAVGTAAANLFSPDGLDDAMKEAFCPDGDKDDLKKTKDNLFNASGLGLGVTDDSFDCLYRVLNSILSKNEYTNLFINNPGQMNPETLRKIAEAVKAFCPEFAGVFGTPGQVGDVFGNMNKYISPALRDFLRDEVQTQPDGPVYSQICLTQEQFDQWNDDRRNLLTGQGLDLATAQDMIDRANNRALDDLGTLIDLLAQGPDGVTKCALDSLMNPTDPACTSVALFEDEEEAEDKSALFKGFFEMLEKLFYRDLIGRPRSILNNILTDSNNIRLGQHELFVKFPLIFPNYVNSDEDWDFRKENSMKLISWRMEKARKAGMFPETVGLWMKKQLDSQSFTYNTTPGQAAIVMTYEDNGGGEGDPEYKFEINYYVEHEPKDLKEIVVDQFYIGRLSRRQKKKLGLVGLPNAEELFPGDEVEVESFPDLEKYDTFDYDDYKNEFSYQSRIFKTFLEDKVDGKINDNNTLNDVYGEINTTVLNFGRNAITTAADGGIPTGFKFGYDSDTAITFADLLYVDPDADPDDPSTWMYTHENEDAILGKSATENPRVHFLDPTIHGGSYKRPFKFIEPATYNGWLGMVKTFIPMVKVCDDTDEGFLDVAAISKRAKDVENSLPFDERLSTAFYCRLQVPYDKIAAPATHGIMEGVVVSTTKIYSTEFILKTLAVFSSVEFSELNIDDTFLAVLMKGIETGLMQQTSRWNLVQGYTYYLLFLEQAVQVVQRQIKDGLMEKTPKIEKAMNIINDAQRAYDPFNVDNFIEGAAIIAFGKEALDEDGNVDSEKLSAVDKAKIVRKMALMTPFKLQIATKIKTINDTKKQAEIIYAALVKQELGTLINKIQLNLRPRPHVKDIRKYLLSRNGILFASGLKSGEMAVEQPVFEGQSGIDYGEIPNVVRDVYTENPLAGQELKIGAGNFSVPGNQKLAEFFLEGSKSMALDAASEFLRSKGSGEGREAAVGVVGEFLQGKFKEALDLGRSGIFYLEKYLRVTTKEGISQVYNIEEFQEYLRNTADTRDPESKISDNFGNASLYETLGEGTVIQGTIGIKFGVRLIYSPPPGFDYDIPPGREKERTYQLANIPVKVKFDKSFYRVLETFPDKVQEFLAPALDKMELDLPSLSRAIPLIIFEQDIRDKKMSELDLNDPNFGEDLKCYVDNLVLEEDFDVLFDFCFPIKSYISLFGIYSYYGFFSSLGEDEEEIDKEAGPKSDRWKSRIFKRSKNTLRDLFNDTYRTDDDVKEERKGRTKNENAKFLKNLMPDLHLNIDWSTLKFWQAWRILDVNPFDAEGNSCKNEFQSLFD